MTVRSAGSSTAQTKRKPIGAAAAAFILTAALLILTRRMAPFTILLADRFVPGAGWAGILLLALYAAFILSRMATRPDTSRLRVGIWSAFSVVFFTQFILGVAGIEQLLKAAGKVSHQLSRRVPTPGLNQALQSWIQEHPIPAGRKNIKIRYAVQISSAPVIFLFFCNRPKNVVPAYRRYLMNKIRREFGFDSVPLRLEFRRGSVRGE